MNPFIDLPLCMLHDFLESNIIVCYLRPPLVAVMESFKWRFCRELSHCFRFSEPPKGLLQRFSGTCNVCMIAVLFVSGYVVDIS